MTQPFPFSAIVGQEEMKLAMVLTAIDPGIGGVLVFGDRGTGKSTAVRGLAALLPPLPFGLASRKPGAMDSPGCRVRVSGASLKARSFAPEE